jgi:hypothetical protein
MYFFKIAKIIHIDLSVSVMFIAIHMLHESRDISCFIVFFKRKWPGMHAGCMPMFYTEVTDWKVYDKIL